jgi:hypothetical protein
VRDRRCQRRPNPPSTRPTVPSTSTERSRRGRRGPRLLRSGPHADMLRRRPGSRMPEGQRGERRDSTNRARQVCAQEGTRRRHHIGGGPAGVKPRSTPRPPVRGPPWGLGDEQWEWNSVSTGSAHVCRSDCLGDCSYICCCCLWSHCCVSHVPTRSLQFWGAWSNTAHDEDTNSSTPTDISQRRSLAVAYMHVVLVLPHRTHHKV